MKSTRTATRNIRSHGLPPVQRGLHNIWRDRKSRRSAGLGGVARRSTRRRCGERLIRRACSARVEAVRARPPREDDEQATGEPEVLQELDDLLLLLIRRQPPEVMGRA